MNIAFVKNSHSEFTMVCSNEDGVIMEKTQSTKDFLRHDMMHYCVEKITGLSNSFFGRLIDTSKNEDEIMDTEKVVGIMQGVDKDINFSSGKYMRIITMSFDIEGRERPSYLTKEYICDVKILYLDILRTYNCMKTGDTLNLVIDI